MMHSYPPSGKYYFPKDFNFSPYQVPDRLEALLLLQEEKVVEFNILVAPFHRARKDILHEFGWEAFHALPPVFDFEYAELEERNLTRVNLRHSRLPRACFYRATLNEADLCSTDLFYSDMIGIRLREAILRRAILTGAKLGTGDVEDADFRGAIDVNLTGTTGTARLSLMRRPETAHFRL